MGVSHIGNSRLKEVASGRARFQEFEEQHLHACEVCQSVLYAFLNEARDLSQAGPAEPDAA
ncbi:MAG TPA: hypothetical protein VKY31_13070 [Terriglobia bacterium]|nr:hypothetical protein [Terriglobia bacterium]